MLTIEIENTDKVFRFRLTNGDKKTEWAYYSGYVYLDGYVTATEYYLPPDKALTLLTADEFCKITAVR